MPSINCCKGSVVLLCKNRIKKLIKFWVGVKSGNEKRHMENMR